MTSEPVGGHGGATARAGADWLALREPADAAARSTRLVDQLRARLRTDGRTEIHDLGCGTGSMARWLAVRLEGPQHWVLHDRDADLLARAEADPPRRSADGAAVTVETRHDDISRLEPGQLAGASLITASAVLDMLTSEELQQVVGSCAAAGCPALVTLTVVGRVELAPADPLDEHVMRAFNAHQRHIAHAGRLLGPDAAREGADAFARLGLDVTVEPSPWQLGPDLSALAAEWLTDWLAAATEQDPLLQEGAAAYRRRRHLDAAEGLLRVTVHHQDLLALPQVPRP